MLGNRKLCSLLGGSVSFGFWCGSIFSQAKAAKANALCTRLSLARQRLAGSLR